tara:strand:+ start:660 stop:896 length:237 start_codon:yes stop_codon:yes gene_type:complete
MNEDETEPATEESPRDLRDELQRELIEAFTANIGADQTLPQAASEALIALVSSTNSTCQDVINALSIEDPIKTEVPSE